MHRPLGWRTSFNAKAPAHAHPNCGVSTGTTPTHHHNSTSNVSRIQALIIETAQTSHDSRQTSPLLVPYLSPCISSHAIIPLLFERFQLLIWAGSEKYVACTELLPWLSYRIVPFLYRNSLFNTNVPLRHACLRLKIDGIRDEVHDECCKQEICPTILISSFSRGVQLSSYTSVRCRYCTSATQAV